MNSEAKRQEGNDIYTILREDIISLRLKPGMLFSIKDICEQYRSGRTPTRDALIRLEQEGLITFLPQRGTMISRLDLNRIDNERFIRKSIEENIMRDFVAVFSPTVILRLEDSISEQKEYIREGAIRRFLEADEEFHSLFYQEVNRMYCKQMIDKECCNYKRLRLLHIMTDDNEAAKKAIEEHEAIVSAAAVRDLDKVLYWFGVHIDRIHTQGHRLLRRFPELFQEISGQDRRENSDLQRDFLVSIRSRGL